MTGEDLFSEYKRRSGDKLSYDQLDPGCFWIWEATARSISALKMDHPERQIRSIKPGDAL